MKSSEKMFLTEQSVYSIQIAWSFQTHVWWEGGSVGAQMLPALAGPSRWEALLVVDGPHSGPYMGPMERWGAVRMASGGRAQGGRPQPLASKVHTAALLGKPAVAPEWESQ